MANINFPSSPTDGQTYTFGTFTWKWVAATGTWDAVSSSLSPPYGPSGAVQYNAAGAFGGATAFTSDAAGNVVIGATGSLTYNPGASGGVLYTNGSKVVTSGTALTFDGTNLGVGVSPSYRIHGYIGSASDLETAMQNTVGVSRFGVRGSGNAFAGAFTSGKSLEFWSGGTNTALLDSSGNLGIGVTPSAATIPTIQSEYGVFAGNSYVHIVGNAYYNGGFKYKASSTATMYQQDTAKHMWFTAASGTAGNAITDFATAKMTLTADGKLGIGVTNPGYSLTVLAGAGAQSIFQAGQYGVSNGYTITSNGTVLTHTWYKSGYDAMTLDASGNLGVGTNSPSTYGKLAVVGDGASQVLAYIHSTGSGDVGNDVLRISKYDNNSTTSQVFARFLINNTGTGSGSITANGANSAAFGTYSDARLKKNIVDLPPQLDNICALRPVEFDYIESEGGGHQIGFIAQEMENVYPDTVGERDDGMKTISGWSKTEARLIKAIQELTARVAQLEGAK